MKILIVDDDEDTLANLSDILSDIGYEIEGSNCAEDAIAKVEMNAKRSGSSNYDLCLLDFKMPGINGAELFTKIRQIDPALKAIMITAYAGSDGIERAISAGTWKVLRKPVDIETLIALIQEATAR
ncbi:MAG: response regulator [Planctomycetota bacterium]